MWHLLPPKLEVGISVRRLIEIGNFNQISPAASVGPDIVGQPCRLCAPR